MRETGERILLLHRLYGCEPQGGICHDQRIQCFAGLTFLDVNKASDLNRTCYDPVTKSSLMDDPANTGGESLWVSPGVQVLPLMNGVIEIKSLVPIWIWETGKSYSACFELPGAPGAISQF